MPYNIPSVDRYSERKLHKDDEQIFREMLKPRHWDFGKFKEVLVTSSILETYPYNTPESIHFGKLRKFVDDLKKKTSETNKEHARGCFVNLKEKKLTFGKTTRGDEHSGRINWDTPESSASNYKRTMSFHTHPTIYSGLHLSPTDYVTFLNDPEQVCMLINCADTELLVLKSSRTPDAFNLQALQKEVESNTKEFLPQDSKLQDIIRFNKAVCIDNALSLYMATSKNRDLAEKVDLFDDPEML